MTRVILGKLIGVLKSHVLYDTTRSSNSDHGYSSQSLQVLQRRTKYTSREQSRTARSHKDEVSRGLHFSGRLSCLSFLLHVSSLLPARDQQ